MFFTYIIFSDSNKKHYVGHTSNIDKRIERHNSHLVQSTKNGAPWKLIHKEVFNNRKDAVLKEKQIKKRGATRYLNDIR